MHDSKVIKQFIQMGDLIKMESFHWMSKEIQISRTRYEISLSKTDFYMASIHHRIPSKFMNDIKLLIIRKSDPELGEFYTVSRSDNSLIKHNGVYVTEAILSIGDIIQFFDTKLFFEMGKENNLVNEIKKRNIAIELKEIDRAAESNHLVLLCGETGTGKSTLAKDIHLKSKRMGAFVQLNLSAIPKEIVEGELFGYEKGSFTGATKSFIGHIASAEHGTLFLDEVDSLSEEMQVKLLLFLDNLEYRMLGSSRLRKANLRLILSTQVDLIKLKQKIRSDFFYRMTSAQIIQIKPIRERKDFVKNMIDQFEIENKVYIQSELKKRYLDYHWPGNIRELQGHLNRKLFNLNGKIINECEYDQLFLNTDLCNREVKSKCINGLVSLSEYKKNYVKKVVETVESKKVAAEILKISLKTLNAMAA